MALSEDEDFVEEEEGEEAEEQAAPKRSRSKKGVAAVRAERHHWLKGGQEQGHSPKRHGGRRAQPQPRLGAISPQSQALRFTVYTCNQSLSNRKMHPFGFPSFWER